MLDSKGADIHVKPNLSVIDFCVLQDAVFMLNSSKQVSQYDLFLNHQQDSEVVVEQIATNKQKLLGLRQNTVV